MAQSTGSIADFTLGNANADLSAKQYTCVKHLTTGLVDTAGAGDLPRGIQQNKPLAGEGVSVRTMGTSKLVVDGSGTAIAIGDALKPDSTGRGVKTVTAADNIIGYAMAASTAANDVIEVDIQIRPQG